MTKGRIQRYYPAYLVIAFFVVSCGSNANKNANQSAQNINAMKDTLNVQKVTSKDGTTIGFRKSGSGPPLLLIHGTTADHRRWSGILASFEERFTVYAMDRRGRGLSTDAPDYSIFREAEDVATVLEHIGEPVFVLGHSYGAVCALESTLLTDKIRRLILYEPPIPTGVPMYPGNVPEGLQALIDRDSLEAALKLFMQEVVRMPGHELKVYSQLPMWKERIKLVPTIPREVTIDRSYQFDAKRFAHYQVPILLLLGGDSPELFRRAIAVLDSALTSSAVVTLPGQQHIAMDTNPELFVGEVVQFLVE